MQRPTGPAGSYFANLGVTTEVLQGVLTEACPAVETIVICILNISIRTSVSLTDGQSGFNPKPRVLVWECAFEWAIKLGTHTRRPLPTALRTAAKTAAGLPTVRYSGSSLPRRHRSTQPLPGGIPMGRRRHQHRVALVRKWKKPPSRRTNVSNEVSLSDAAKVVMVVDRMEDLLRTGDQ